MEAARPKAGLTDRPSMSAQWIQEINFKELAFGPFLDLAEAERVARGTSLCPSLGPETEKLLIALQAEAEIAGGRTLA